MTGTNMELGWKADWFGNSKLNSALSLFHIIQKNRSVTSSARSEITNKFYNIPLGRVESKGFDAEISGQLTPDWNIFAGYTFNTSQYKEREGTQAYYQAGANFNNWTPKHMFRLYTNYNVTPQWTVGGGMSIQSKTSNLYMNIKQGGYAIWNANVKYAPRKDMTISLIGSNLLNKRYYENNRVRTLGMNNFLGEPRNVTLTFDWKFK